MSTHKNSNIQVVANILREDGRGYLAQELEYEHAKEQAQLWAANRRVAELEAALADIKGVRNTYDAMEIPGTEAMARITHVLDSRGL